MGYRSAIVDRLGTHLPQGFRWGTEELDSGFRQYDRQACFSRFARQRYGLFVHSYVGDSLSTSALRTAHSVA